MEQFRKVYEYAQRNGYKGDFVQYVQLQYAGYKTICERMQVSPLSCGEWLRARATK